MPGSLPGLERLIAVLEKHGVGVDPKPPSPLAPRAGELVLGEPYDPQLAEVHARFGGGAFGDFVLLDVEGPLGSLVSRNEHLRRGWETLEPRLKRLFRYGQDWHFEYYFATVPSLAGAGGLQPVVHLTAYDEMPIMPIASSVDRAFDLWASYCERRFEIYGTLDTQIDVEHGFPWALTARLAEDRALVQMLAEQSFDSLLLQDPETGEWVKKILAAACG